MRMELPRHLKESYLKLVTKKVTWLKLRRNKRPINSSRKIIRKDICKSIKIKT